MSAEHLHPTPEQANEQLVIGQAASLSTGSDRRIHAVGTAVLGVTVGLFLAAGTDLTGAQGVLLSCVFVLVCAAEAIWVERAARTVPRRARLWSRLGFGVSMILALAGVLPWLNLQAQDGPVSRPALLLAALIIAAPSLAAAAVMTRERP